MMNQLSKIMLLACTLHATRVFSMNAENGEERTQGQEQSIVEESQQFLMRLEAARAKYNEKEALERRLNFSGRYLPQSRSFNAAR